MRCGAIMKEDVAVVRRGEPIERAAQLMRDEGVGFLPVIDSGGQVLGAITDRDLVVRAMAERRPASTPVDEVMTREIIACSPDDELETVHSAMRSRHVSRIMGIDPKGKLVGVLSLSDLAQHTSVDQAGQTLQDVSERETTH